MNEQEINKLERGLKNRTNKELLDVFSTLWEKSEQTIMDENDSQKLKSVEKEILRRMR